MDKFSLFDLLSLLFPGIVVLYFLKIIAIIVGFDLVPEELELNNASEIGIGLCVILPDFQARGLVKNKHTKFDYTDETKTTQILRRIQG